MTAASFSVDAPAGRLSGSELSFLLLCVSTPLSVPEVCTFPETVGAPFCWDRVLALAVRHNVEPLLYHNLSRGSDMFALPEQTMERLRAESKLIAGRSLKLAAILAAVSTHLQGRGIPHIVYKGPLLAERYYGNCALRAYRDLDLLVPPDRVLAAAHALAEIGFRDKAGLTPSQQVASFRFGFEHPFTAPGAVDLDLHWQIVQHFKAPSIDMASIWRRVVMEPFWGGEVPSFAPADHVVALCLHVGHHGWMQISHLCDLALVLRAHPDLDWDVVLSHLGSSNTRRLVYVSLLLAHEFLAVILPPSITVAIAADPHAARIARRVATEIWPQEAPALTTSNFGWLLDRTAGESVVDRLRLLAGSAFFPAVEDVETFRLSLSLSPLYFLLRPLRLVFKRIVDTRAHDFPA